MDDYLSRDLQPRLSTRGRSDGSSGDGATSETTSGDVLDGGKSERTL
jgi:hypothetical protein